MTVYDFIVQDKDGNKVSLSEYRGKTILIINSATECGFTPQYANLQDLYNRYQDKGFVIFYDSDERFIISVAVNDEIITHINISARL